MQKAKPCSRKNRGRFSFSERLRLPDLNPVFIIFIVVSLYAYPLLYAEETPEALFGALDAIISGPNDSMAETTAQSESLNEIISLYYAEAVVKEEVPLEVLGYLTNAYSGRGFYETGYWGKTPASKRQFPVYNGPVPKSSLSDFQRPVSGMITSDFGFRQRYGRIHHGIDISLHTGDTVRAALPGVVTYVSYEPGGYGKYVILAHSDGLETRYAHLSESLVMPGETVRAGEPIALGGTTGNSTGPHLHFETRVYGMPLDPRNYIKFPR